ncbi:MAG: hypothetical protein AB1422_19455 [bacterium]
MLPSMSKNILIVDGDTSIREELTSALEDEYIVLDVGEGKKSH